MSVEDWAEIRRLHRSERMPIKAIARVLGISRNTVRAKLAADAPPKYVRAVLYQYWFSTPEEKRTQGVWWKRQLLGTYAPTLERGADGKFAVVEEPTLAGPPQM